MSNWNCYSPKCHKKWKFALQVDIWFACWLNGFEQKHLQKSGLTDLRISLSSLLTFKGSEPTMALHCKMDSLPPSLCSPFKAKFYPSWLTTFIRGWYFRNQPCWQDSTSPATGFVFVWSLVYAVILPALAPGNFPEHNNHTPLPGKMIHFHPEVKFYS